MGLIAIGRCLVSTQKRHTPTAVACRSAVIHLPDFNFNFAAKAGTGGSGFALSGERKGNLLAAKKRRMQIIAANGLLILLPCYATAPLLDSTNQRHSPTVGSQNSCKKAG